MSCVCKGVVTGVKDFCQMAPILLRAFGDSRSGKARSVSLDGSGCLASFAFHLAFFAVFSHEQRDVEARFWRNGIFFVRKVVQLPAYYRGIELR